MKEKLEAGLLRTRSLPTPIAFSLDEEHELQIASVIDVILQLGVGDLPVAHETKKKKKKT